MTRADDHMNHGSTMLLGAILTAATARDLVTALGILIGIVGAASSVSREARAWIERWERKREAASHREGRGDGRPGEAPPVVRSGRARARVSRPPLSLSDGHEPGPELTP